MCLSSSFMRGVFGFILVAFCGVLHANIYCSNVPVKLESATYSGYHGFNQAGAEGEVAFIAISPQNCTANNGDQVGSNIFLVIDKLEDKNATKQLWLSILMAAQASGSKISFSSTLRGTNSSGWQILKAYRLSFEK